MENPYASPATVASDDGVADEYEELVLATRFSRWLAAFIDGLIIFIPLALVLLVFSVGLESFDAEEDSTLLEVFYTLAWISAYLAVNGYLLATSGQTIGKKLMSIRIVQSDGKLMPFGPLMLKRYAPFWFASLFPIAGLINLIDVLLIFRENRRCLHDDLADTIVVQA